MSEDLLMEHAAIALKEAIPNEAKRVLIVSGAGNNGADGVALARLIQGKKDVCVYLPFGAKSPMAELQKERAKRLEVRFVDSMDGEWNVIVDALFGSGLNKPLNEEAIDIVTKINSINAYKIACDIPSGLNLDGIAQSIAVIADKTVTMGGYKEALFSDEAKDFVGEIVRADLGVSSEAYEDESETYLLEREDLTLPLRERKNTHKGDFGHLAVVAGAKVGAGIIAARSAFAFGAGKVTIVENEPYIVPYEIMSCSSLPSDASAVCIGMGLGKRYDDEYLSKFLLDHELPMILDADLFYEPILIKVLESRKDLVLTPHPKEFTSLLSLTDVADVETKELQKRRFELLREFTYRFRDIVVVLKGANTLIGQNGTIYINSFGGANLSKGGSGDVLGGLIASLLSQGYSPLKAAINASLAHTFAAEKFDKNSYALTPRDLIEEVKCL
jgi:hydroxyethylthiazole kinase-like uncharacterized protein yjeF